MIKTCFTRVKFGITQSFASVASVRKKLTSEPFLVIMDKGKYEGILTSQDIALRPYMFVADCVTKKPSVSHNISVKEALNKMNDGGVTTLASFDGTKFIGVILLNDLNEEIREHNQQLKATSTKQLNELNKLTQELKKTKVSDGTKRGFRGMTHDMRNAVAIIKSASYLAVNSKNEAEREQFLDRIDESCQYTTAMLNRLGEMLTNDGDEAQLGLVEVNTLVMKEVNVFQSAALVKDITIKFKPTAVKLYAGFPILKLQRIVANLLSNAIKFTNRGGFIEASTSQRHKKIYVKIQDTGIGIPNDLKTIIFEGNSKARRVGTEGESTTGMGLSMVKDLIESGGGKIEVISEENIGTTFQISLPEA